MSACPLFAILPPEIRNQIYEYVFTTDSSTHRNLVTAKYNRPWSNLLLTCQRVFFESNGIYRTARITYWSGTTFYVNRTRKFMFIWPSAQHIVDSLHDRELDLIQKVIISSDHGDVHRPWHLIAGSDSMQGWIATAPHLHDTNSLSLVGRRSGLHRIIEVLS